MVASSKGESSNAQKVCLLLWLVSQKKHALFCFLCVKTFHTMLKRRKDADILVYPNDLLRPR